MFLPLILPFLPLLTLAQNPPQCHALVLEGGGPRGAYEVGALLAITEFLPANQTAYQVISGISIGAMNSCFTLGFPIGQERAMALYLQKIWMSITSSSMLYSPWWGFYSKGGFVNTEKLYKFIEANTGSVIDRFINVAATNLDTGDYVNFNTSVGMEIIQKACYASGAYPPFFPPVEVLGVWYGDGAMTANSNPFEAIDYCRSKGYQDSNIVLDMLYDLPVQPAVGAWSNNTKQMIIQINLVKVFFTNQWYTETFEEEYPNIDLRYFVKPSITFISTSISQNYTEYMINTGYSDTKSLIFMNKAERNLKYRENREKSFRDF